MRTTVDLDYDTLIAAKEIARMENTSLGKVISRLVRQALTGNATAQAASSPVTSRSAGSSRCRMRASLAHWRPACPLRCW